MSSKAIIRVGGVQSASKFSRLGGNGGSILVATIGTSESEENLAKQSQFFSWEVTAKRGSGFTKGDDDKSSSAVKDIQPQLAD